MTRPAAERMYTRCGGCDVIKPWSSYSVSADGVPCDTHCKECAYGRQSRRRAAEKAVEEMTPTQLRNFAEYCIGRAEELS